MLPGKEPALSITRTPAHNYSIESKLSYVEKVDDTWFLGSGIYTGPAVTATTNGQGLPK